MKYLIIKGGRVGCIADSVEMVKMPQMETGVAFKCVILREDNSPLLYDYYWPDEPTGEVHFFMQQASYIGITSDPNQ